MSRPDTTPGRELTPEQTDRLREAVTDAVLSAVPGLREAMRDDPSASLALVHASRAAAEETSRLLQEAITGARRAGHSWDSIGRLLGVSRQAAQQRFGVPGPPRPTAAGRRVLSPLTAFDEMAVLEHEGRRGWHVVDFGPLFHVVEASDRAWEHRRAVWSPSVARGLRAEGWMPVGEVTFPWGYWKRCLDEPAQE